MQLPSSKSKVAAVQGIPPIAPQAIFDPRCVITYAQWYSKANNDPFHGGYAPVLQAFAMGTGFNVAPVTLLEQAPRSVQSPQAFLILTSMVRGN